MYVGKKRRIRHIKAILGRNIASSHPPCNNPVTLENTTTLQSFTDSSLTQQNIYKQPSKQLIGKDTLLRKENGLLDTYVTLYTRNEDLPFYTSETVPYSINPAFQTTCVNDDDGIQTHLIVRVWARLSLPDLVCRAQPYDLVLEWSMDLEELAFIGTSLQGTWPNNTLLFELDDGHFTAPDIAEFILEQQRHKDSASIDSIQSPRSKRSYTYHHIMKLNTLKDCLLDAQCSSNDLQSDINLLMKKDNVVIGLSRQKVQKQTKLKELEFAIKATRKRIEQERQRVNTLRQTVSHQKHQLERCRERYDAKDSNYNDTQLEAAIHRDISTKLDQRRKELIADLFSLYPIEQSLDESTQCRIRGIHLPNSVYASCDEDVVATALGFTSHLVTMLAFYLSIPLRYPINPMGSRASIYDPISLINGSRTFPLYAKGVDKYRFEFGIFLLNKNIEQMMNTHGLMVMDLRHTLPNIHYMIQSVLTTSVSSGPSSISVLSISSYAHRKEELPLIKQSNDTHLTPSHSLKYGTRIEPCLGTQLASPAIVNAPSSYQEAMNRDS